jgi:hypothetical protein
MLRYTPAVLALMLAVHAPSSAHAAQSKNTDVVGVWTLTRVLDSAEITSMDDKQAARLVGKTVVIRPDKVVVVGEDCDQSDFERHREPAAKYVRENYHAPVGRLGLPDTVTVVNLGCTEALLKGKNGIVLFWDGFFYEAAKLNGTTKRKEAER